MKRSTKLELSCKVGNMVSKDCFDRGRLLSQKPRRIKRRRCLVLFIRIRMVKSLIRFLSPTMSLKWMRLVVSFSSRIDWTAGSVRMSSIMLRGRNWSPSSSTSATLCLRPSCSFDFMALRSGLSGSVWAGAVALLRPAHPAALPCDSLVVCCSWPAGNCLGS